MSEHNPGFTFCVECKKDIHEKVARRCPNCFQRPLCAACAETHRSGCLGPREAEKEKAMFEQEISCKGCGRGLTAFGHQAASTCAKCGRGPYCSRCDVNHAETCQKPPGFTCKLCGDKFEMLSDFTMHAETCVRRGFACEICQTCKKDLSSEECHWSDGKGQWWCSDCHSGLCQEKSDLPKVGGNQGLPADCHAWFSLRNRKPTEEESKALTIVRREYGVLMRVLLNKLPSNPDRTAAIRQLKESMQTAISSIVCADAWQTPKGD